MLLSFNAGPWEFSNVRTLPLLRAALVGTLIVSATGAASARDGRNAALLGGAALGAIGGVALGAALASPPPPPPYYRPRPVYLEEAPPVYAPPPGPVCHYEQRKQWLNEVEFTYRRVQICE